MLRSAIVSTLLIAWFVVSAISQVRQVEALGWLRRLDIGSLIPAWTFFAPRPGTTDHVLVYHDVDEAGLVTPWRLVHSPMRRSRAVVWNPDKRVEKLITDCASNLTTRGKDPPPAALEAEYLLLQRLVENAQHDCRAVSTQFVLLDVAETRVDPRAKPLLVSPVVPLDKAVH